MKIKIRATDQQLLKANHMHQINEGLLARTLAARLRQCRPEDTEEQERFIREWFSTVRTMGIATQAMAGVEIMIEPDEGDL